MSKRKRQETTGQVAFATGQASRRWVAGSQPAGFVVDPTWGTPTHAVTLDGHYVLDAVDQVVEFHSHGYVMHALAKPVTARTAVAPPAAMPVHLAVAPPAAMPVHLAVAPPAAIPRVVQRVRLHEPIDVTDDAVDERQPTGTRSVKRQDRRGRVTKWL